MIRTEIGTFCCKDCYNEFLKNKWKITLITLCLIQY
jgi:hypothetical protein